MVERQGIRRYVAHFILWIGIAIVAFPVYLAFVASTQEAYQIANGHMSLLPGGHLIEVYKKTLFTGTSGSTREPVGVMLFNSFVMAMSIALGKIAISILSAYAIVYFRFPFRMWIFWLIFMTLMLPVEVRIYPTYKIAADLHLLGIVSESGYEGQAHWLMFLFEVKPRLEDLPPPHAEGRFAFFARLRK